MAAPSRNVIEETLLAYAFERPTPSGRIEAALDRVGDHYSRLLAGPVRRHADLGERHGLALWVPEDAERLWPLWVVDGPRCAAASSVVTGWERVVGTVPATRVIAAR